MSGSTVPWLWSRGGPEGEDAIWRILGGWPHSRGTTGLNEERGSVVLAAIPIRARPSKSFDVDRDPLIAEVMKVVARIGPKEIKAIARFVANLKDSDDS